MAEIITLEKSRVQRIDIKNSDGEILGTAVFNPHDMSIYRKYTEIRMALAKDKQEYEKHAAEYDALDKSVPEEELLETSEYEKLDTRYRHEMKLGDGISKMYADLKTIVDSIFGEGIYDLMTHGYEDEVMLDPLFESANPFFEQAAKERKKRLDEAKLNREQRRAKK